MVDKVFEAIEKVLGVTREEIRSKKRHADIVEARHIFCYLLWKQGLVERKIGLEVCKDTSSVHYALSVMINLKDKSKIEKVKNEQERAI